MIWIGSFPRSGNTFLRNVLFEVYGIRSSTFHREKDHPLDKDYESYVFVKTHELPELIRPADPAIPAVYLVRDGRDALCSIAHHRSDVVEKDTDFLQNLKEAIIADRESYFGGWSKNVEEWMDRAKIMIRFEDLIIDPIKQLERVREIYPDLPQGNPDKLPTFQDLKLGIPQYGSGKDYFKDEEQKHEMASKWFRKGKVGGWKEEMPDDLHELFWSYHGDTMIKLGYSYEGNITDIDPDFDYEVLGKLGVQIPKPEGKVYRVLFEGKKLLRKDNDGVKRYAVELLKELTPAAQNPDSNWMIDVHLDEKVLPLSECVSYVHEDFRISRSGIPAGSVAAVPDNSDRLEQKTLFQRLSEFSLTLVPQSVKNFLVRNKVMIFHRIYDALVHVAHWAYQIALKVYVFVTGIFRKIKNKVSGLLVSVIMKSRKRTYSNEIDHRLLKSALSDSYLSRILGNYDLIHLPIQHHFSPYLNAKTNVVVTVHDYTHKYFPQHHTAENIKNSDDGIKYIKDIGAHVINVSRSTLKDTLSEIQISRDKNHLTLEAIDRKKFRHEPNREVINEVLAKYGVPGDRPYLLCLSTIEPRKNLVNTIKAFQLFHDTNWGIILDLVIAGKKGWKVSGLVEKMKDNSRVHFTGFADDNDLAFLYSGAKAFVYVSYYEGFGLPLLEAMNCRVPVIYGNNSSMPEVVGDGGLPADPFDFVDIKKKMEAICLNEEYREELASKALRQANKFSWRKTAKETLGIYEKIIKESQKSIG